MTQKTIYNSIVDFTIDLLIPEPKTIIGPNSVCIGDTTLYTVDNPLHSNFCWNVNGGGIINKNKKGIA